MLQLHTLKTQTDNIVKFAFISHTHFKKLERTTLLQYMVKIFIISVRLPYWNSTFPSVITSLLHRELPLLSLFEQVCSHDDLNFLSSKISLFCTYFWRIPSQYRIMGWQLFFSPACYKDVPVPSVHIVSDKQSSVIWIVVPLYVMCHFSLSLVFSRVIMMCLDTVFLEFIWFGVHWF